MTLHFAYCESTKHRDGSSVKRRNQIESKTQVILSLSIKVISLWNKATYLSSQSFRNGEKETSISQVCDNQIV